MDLVLGIDLGTSGCRICAVDAQGQIQAQTRTNFPAPIVNGPAVEQDPQIWWDGCLQCLEQLNDIISAQDIRAISVDGTSSTVLVCDADGKPRHSALMYNDARAQAQAQKAQALIPADSAARGASATVAKILWLKEHGVQLKGYKILHQADWIAGKLSGQFQSSDSNNCLKLGYDAVHKQWSPWLGQLGIPMESLPQVVSAGKAIGLIKPGLATRLGYPAQTQIVAGTTDSTAAFIASGASEPGDAVTALGSTMVLKLLSDKPFSAPEYGVYSQPYFNKWLLGGASNSGGAVLLHYFTTEQMRDMTPMLEPQHDTGLNYYPLLRAGERFPVADANLKPRLSPRPEHDHQFFQGLLEGIAAVEKQGYDLLHQLSGIYPKKVFTNGGGASNENWSKIRQRYLNVPVIKAQHTEAAYGAAKLALMGITENQSPGG